ncbi:TPA: DUF2971 domain-containing protein [Vibrio parahaemolyticus]|nr:DUF2971 domain-containing protein [Vibrio parahaemolyticus]
MLDVRSKVFRNKYKWPKDENIKSLYRFSSFDPDTIKYHQALFEERLLFHNLPVNFNDPFECRPVIQWPESRKEEHGLRRDLASLLIFHGHDETHAEAMARNANLDSNIKKQIEDTLNHQFQTFRICCFTKRKENLLFWSHYADSHRGYCVDYSTSSSIIGTAYKVKYGKKFPYLKFPMLDDLRALTVLAKQITEGQTIDTSKCNVSMNNDLIEPVLNKSIDWKYEEEYRSILKPDAIAQLSNNGECLILEGHEIRNVYFGCNMPKDNRDLLIESIKRGPFTPDLWQAQMRRGMFSLDFKKISI